MNRFRSLAIGTMLMLALTVVAQQAATKSAAPEKLALTGDQQTKIKPILQELHDAMLKAVQDESMSREERLGKVRASREKADKKIREILNDDQKKKLDQLEQEPHSGLHGN